jgi:ATP-binding protein involved in chromosome partitioning
MYGPSVPTMFGVMGRPVSADGKKFLPLERFGVKLMSLGFLLEDPKSAVVWRGPMIQGALLQFLNDVEWGTLDYLVLDLPPGTGDIALTISQKVRTTGSGHRDDAARGRAPGRVQVRVDGAEGRHSAARRGRERELLHLRRLYEAARALRVGRRREDRGFRGAPLLGQIPLDPAIREWGDAGTPVVQAAPDSPIARSFIDVANQLAGRISRENLSRPGSLVIDRSGGANRHLPIAR